MCVSFEIRVTGILKGAFDPFIYTLPKEYCPLTSHRILGYGLNNLEKYYIHLGYNTNLNNLTKTGFYECSKHNNGALNCPTTFNFTLQVYNGYYIHQILESKSKMWIRYYDADNKIWYDWKQIV